MAESRDPYPRQLLPRIRRDLQVYPAVAIMGARQVGKTTLTRYLANELELSYRSLDDRDVRQQALDDPEGLLESVADSGAVFDEVQRAPELLLALKAVIDRDQRLGRFVLTGSNQPRVGQHVADSLVGRVAYRVLRPLTISEQRYEEGGRRWSWFFEPSWPDLHSKLSQAAELSGDLEWRAAVATGGMPRAVRAPASERGQVLDDYLSTFAQRDIRELLGVESPDRFERFLRLTAARTGQEFNASRMSGDLGVAVNTVRRWVDALERSYLVTRIPAYSRNSSARVIKSPKLFLVDSGLALAGSRDTSPTGFHLETLVANDLLVWRDEASGREISHWRDGAAEVDFVIHQGQAVVAVEIKASAHVSSNDAGHLASFLGKYHEAVLGVLLSGDAEIRLIRDKVVAAPWWAVL
jgi:uncharacterized protein